MTKSEMWYIIMDEVITFLMDEGYKKIKRNKTSLELQKNDEDWKREISVFNLYSNFRISIRFDLTSHILNRELAKRLGSEFNSHIIGGHPHHIRAFMDPTYEAPVDFEFRINDEEEIPAFLEYFKSHYSNFAKPFFEHFSSLENLHRVFNYNLEKGSALYHPDNRILNGLLMADLLATIDKQTIIERLENVLKNIPRYELKPESISYDKTYRLLEIIKSKPS